MKPESTRTNDDTTGAAGKPIGVAVTVAEYPPDSVVNSIL